MDNVNHMTENEEKVFDKLLRDDGIKRDQLLWDDVVWYIQRAKKTVDKVRSDEEIRVAERVKIAQEAGITEEKTLTRIRELVNSNHVQVQLSGSETEVNELLGLLSPR